MKSKLLVLLALASLFLGACGGVSNELGGVDSPATTLAIEDGSLPEDGVTDPGGSGDGVGDSVTPESSGPLAENSIRIGDQVWQRTLPMTTGQCFLYMDDGTLPTQWHRLGNVRQRR
ncbi:hypothetical protein BH23ACT4_BH23ACT4_00070 [soil metagenome]